MTIINDILAGKHDADLVGIIEAAKQRGRSAPLREGDTVRVSDNCSPKYMQGVLCQVVRVTNKTQRGNKVYLVKPLDTDENKRRLYGTKMVHSSFDTGEFIVKMRDINMARDLIEKVSAE